MNRNLNHYAKLYKNFVSDELCDEVVKQLNQSEFEPHTFHDNRTGQYQSRDKDFSILFGKIPHTHIIKDIVLNVLKKYVLEDMKFDWFRGMEGFTMPRFNKYETGTEMHLHCDHISDIFDGRIKGIPTLTVLGSLNDDYTGGDLIMFEDEIIELNKGDIIVFPSNFMYPHKVGEVTSGTRYSYVSWAY